MVEDLIEPDDDLEVQLIFQAFALMCRSRKVTANGYPLELSFSDINDYLALYDCPLELETFIDCVFELDTLFMDKVKKDIKKPSK